MYKSYNLLPSIYQFAKDQGLSAEETHNLINESLVSDNIKMVYDEWLDEESGMSFVEYFIEYLFNYYRYER